MWEVGAAMLNDLESAGVPLTPHHFECVLRACDRKARWQEALALLGRMQAASLRPTSAALECALRACSKANLGDSRVISGTLG